MWAQHATMRRRTQSGDEVNVKHRLRLTVVCRKPRARQPARNLCRWQRSHDVG